MDARTLFVISDLHIGANDRFDIFKSPDKLELLRGFLKHVREWPGPADLIINGDLVDFLQVEPWDDLSRAAALAKIGQICGGSADVFAALGGLLDDGRHRITILLGNHDVEIAYPEVGDVLRRAILAGTSAADAGGRLELIDRRTTHRATVNGVLVHVEHGNKDDAWNAINYNELFNDAETRTTTLALPPGTRFVYDTMNGLKEELQFVDILKPEVPAVILLLMALRPWKSMRSLPGGVRTKLQSMANGWLAALRQRIAGPALGGDPPAAPTSADSPEWVLESELAGAYGEILRRAASRADIDDVEAFLDGVDDDEPTGLDERPTLGFLDPVKVRLVTAALWALARFGKGERPATAAELAAIDHPEEPFAVSARTRLVGDVRLAIYGHTHEALKAVFPDGRVYINSGAWANLMRLPASRTHADLLAWTKALAGNTFERVSVPTFVRVEPSATGAIASLRRWNLKGDEELWKTVISPSS